MSYELGLHIIEDSSGKILAKPFAYQIPAVGDEIRLNGESYWKVVRVIHCYDEDVSYHRANIGVEKA